MHSLRAIIVEDEPSGLENLRWKLTSNCPEIEIVAECPSGAEAIKAIKRHLPDILFLDIMLGDMSGFDVLKEIKHPSFDVIFTTSYDDFAIEAIKNRAIDYLLKPIEIEELMESVARVRAKRMQYAAAPSASAQSSNVRSMKMGFPISTGQMFINTKDIIYASADDNVCILTLAQDQEEVRLSKSLGWVEAKLEAYGFCRIHHSYLINLSQMKEYIRNDGGYVVMNDGKGFSISRRRKDDFLTALTKWNIQ
ncbi:MAG: LytTR family DNA-binding domain-containing protein [Bacteroidota bacterium]